MTLTIDAAAPFEIEPGIFLPRCLHEMVSVWCSWCTGVAETGTDEED